jgi:DNA polymerase-3 subunit gamma/tau
MIAHLNRIAKAEGIVVDQTAQGLLARAAEGSVRDGLSLLDQAIAHAGTEIDADTVRAMLGLSDRTRVFDLFRLIMSGEIAQALSEIRAQYDAGADPQAILRDLLDLTHFLTRIKIVAEAADDVTLAENERNAARDLAARLTMPVLARAWQLLLKGFGEVRDAPSPIAAAEMLVVRLAYAADLPNPADLVRQLKDQGPASSAQGRAPAGPSPQGSSAPRMSATATGGASAMASPAPAQAAAKAMPANIEALAELAGAMRDGQLKYQIENHMHVVRFERGRIEFRPTERAPQSLAADLTAKISNWTAERWIVSISNDTGQATLAEQKRAAEQAMRLEIRNHPLVAQALSHFPDAELMDVRDMVQTAVAAPVDEPDDFGEDRPMEGSIDPYEDAED